MTCFNAFSHGSQDLYPTSLQTRHGFTPRTTGTIGIIYKLGGLSGGILFGTFSNDWAVAAVALAALLALPMFPLWAYSTAPVMFAVGAILPSFAY